MSTCLQASLPAPELLRWKRSSLRPWVKAYLVAMATSQPMFDSTPLTSSNGTSPPEFQARGS
jgi:hypothetical protein